MLQTGRLSAERIQRLQTLGVVWEVRDTAWEQRCQELAAFRAGEGHSNVPFNSRLGKWLLKQRGLRKRGALPHARVARLNALGVKWEPHDASWEQQFRQLEAFKERRGHCRVPVDADTQQLAAWVERQRREKRRGVLSRDRIAAT